MDFIYDKILSLNIKNILKINTILYDFAINMNSRQTLNELLSDLEKKSLYEKKNINNILNKLKQNNLEMVTLKNKKNSNLKKHRLEKLIKEQAVTFYNDTSKLTVEEPGIYSIELKRNLNVNVYNVIITLFDTNSTEDESKLIRLIYKKLKGNIIDKIKNKNITIMFYVATNGRDPEHMIKFIEKQLTSTFNFNE